VTRAAKATTQQAREVSEVRPTPSSDEPRHRGSAEALREIVLTLGSSLQLSVILERTLEYALDLVGANAVVAFWLEDGLLVSRLSLGLETAFLTALRFPAGAGAIGRSMREDAPVLAKRLSAADKPGVDLGFPYKSMIALPLAARGQRLGALALYFERSQQFAGTDVETLRLFATQAAVALENARLFEEEVRREREQAVLLRVARLTGATLELDEVLSRLALEVTDALDLERCFVGFFDSIEDDRAELGKLYAFGFDQDLERLRPFVIVEDAFETLLIARRPMFFNDVVNDPSLEDQGSALLEAQSCVIAPIVAQGQVLGLLYADSVLAGSSVSEREANLAAAIADQAALAIQNARLYTRIEAERSRYSLLAEAAHDVILTTDLEGRINYANPAVLEAIGFEPAELIGREYASLLEPAAALEARRAWRSLLFGGSAITYEGQVRRKDGRLAYLEVNLNALRQDGRMIGGLAIARDLSEKRQLADEIAARGQEEQRALELRSYLNLFTQAQEEERGRVARELHDDTAQSLVAIGRRLDRLEAMLSDDDAKQRTRDIRGDVDATIESVRRFSRNLRPSVLDDLGLIPALEWLCAQSRTPTRLEVAGREARLPSVLELTLFRVVQEALTNVDKHAMASSAAVRVEFVASNLEPEMDGTGVRVRITDDGQGFQNEPSESLALEGHLGLAGMRERVRLAGGQLRTHSSPGEGATVELWLPLETN
jgi:two-component system, NarL family, sensor histidine kinase UhpB